jgi:putative ABC transport system permease protein
MTHSTLKLSIRNLFRKNRIFTIINIAGLAVGMTSLLLVLLFIDDEYSFDRYHKNADRIHRVILDFTSDDAVTNWAKTSAPIGHYLAGAYPEIEQVVRLRKNPGTDLLDHVNTQFYEERIFFADSTLFKVFDFELVKGNSSLALKDINSIVISKSLARKYFHSDDPIGKSFRFNNQTDLTVTGVMEDIPANSHFVADAFISFSSLEELLGEKRLSHWGQFDHYTYILLAKNSDPKEVELKFMDLLKNHAPEWVSEKEILYLQPLTAIHLHSDRKDEITPNSSENYSYVLGVIALFIILMAAANFINLSTASQVSRTKEIAIQKILGANRMHMAAYFCIESVVISIVALLVAFFLAYIALPSFNLVTGKQISLFQSNWLIILSLLVAIVVGSISSIVPALQAFRTQTIHTSRPIGNRVGRPTVRNILITFQFSLSILLIIASLVVSAQWNLLKSMRLGYESDNIVVIPVKDRSQNSRYGVIVNEINQLNGIDKACFSSSTPGSNDALTYTYSFPGTGVEDRSMATFLIDENFIDLYKISLKAGRTINVTNHDTINEVLLNEAAVQELKLLQPVGQLVVGKVKGRVIGVVKNFNHASLHSIVEPVIMYAYTPTFRFVSVKLEGDPQQGLASLETRWPELYPGYPLEYKFLDDQIRHLYASEFQLRQAYTSFFVIAIIIAGIGLVGLTVYLMTRKLKEISIRKVFGSNTFQLILHIYSGYIKIILIAVVVSWGAGYYWSKRWLEGFPFKAELNLYHFIGPAIAMIIVLLLTTGIQTLRASRINPIENLREE